MDKSKVPKLIYVRESAIQSIISDVISFGIPALLAYLNYAYLGNAVTYQILICFVFFISACAGGKKKAATFYTVDDAIAHLQKEAHNG